MCTIFVRKVVMINWTFYIFCNPFYHVNSITWLFCFQIFQIIHFYILCPLIHNALHINVCILFWNYNLLITKLRIRRFTIVYPFLFWPPLKCLFKPWRYYYSAPYENGISVNQMSGQLANRWESPAAFQLPPRHALFHLSCFSEWRQRCPDAYSKWFLPLNKTHKTLAKWNL